MKLKILPDGWKKGEKMRLFFKGERWTDILETRLGSVSVEIRYLEDEYLHDIQTNYDHQYFYYYVKCFHCFKTNEIPHNLIIGLCIISGEVVFANCGHSCASGKSGFCTHVQQ